MIRTKLIRRSLVAIALLLGTSQYARAGVIYVTDSAGSVWKYNSVSHMSTQTQSTNVGILVRDASTAGDTYKNDQDATCDLSTGIVYRITGAGDIVSYVDVAAYLTNSNPVVEATAIYTGNKAINGLSYDGATGGFYSVSPAGTTNPGDIARYNTLATFKTGTPDSVSVAGYNGNTLNFYDPDPTPGNTVGNATFPSHAVNARYYQVPGGGGLEGFESIADYVANAVNRVNFTAANAFGGTSPQYLARAAFAVPVPEPTSVVLVLGIVAGIASLRRR